MGLAFRMYGLQYKQLVRLTLIAQRFGPLHLQGQIIEPRLERKSLQMSQNCSSHRGRFDPRAPFGGGNTLPRGNSCSLLFWPQISSGDQSLVAKPPSL